MKVDQVIKEEMVFPSSSDMVKMLYKDIVRLYAGASTAKHEDLVAGLKNIVDKYATARVDVKRTTTQY